MPFFAEHEPTAAAELAAGAEPGMSNAPRRLAAGGTARTVGDPVADPTPATLKLYAGDWARFVTWCREQRRLSLPASSETLAAYLVDCAPELSRGALGRRRSAISTVHRQAGLPTPILSRQTTRPCGKRQSRRARGRRPHQRGPGSSGWQPNARAILPACATARCCSWLPRHCGHGGAASGRPGRRIRAARRWSPRVSPGCSCWRSMPSTSASRPPGWSCSCAPASTRRFQDGPSR